MPFVTRGGTGVPGLREEDERKGRERGEREEKERRGVLNGEMLL